MSEVWVPAPPRDAHDGHAVIACSCPDGAYIGARKAGTVDCCEVCGFITPAQLSAIQAAAVSSRLAAVEALADEWLSEECEDSEVTYGSCGDHLRAALTAAPDSEDRQAGRALRGPRSGSAGLGGSE